MRFVYEHFFAALYASIAERRDELSLKDLANVTRSIGSTKYVDQSVK
jgi:hypothetical protein